MYSKPTPEHEWLMQLVGKWSFEHESVCGPEGEVHTSTGTEIVRALGDLWVIGELTSEMGDGFVMVGVTTLGYDSGKKAYVGSWVGTPMESMFVYQGTRDASGKVLTLDCEGPGFADPSVRVPYQDIIEIVGPDERRLRSRVKQDDGSWNEFMKATFKRLG